MKADALSQETMFFKCLSTEMLFYHAGHPLTVYMLQEGASRLEDLSRVVVGPDVERGQRLSFPVPANTWFTRLVEADHADDFSLFSCSLAPGFNIDDFDAEKIRNLIKS